MKPVEEIILLVVGIYFGTLVVGLVVTEYRFSMAYLRHYRGMTGWRLLIRSLIGGVPWRAPDRPVDTFHRLDAPEVERLRRHSELVWRLLILSLLISFVIFVLLVLLLLGFDALSRADTRAHSAAV